MDIFLFIFIFAATQAVLIDYTRENYILIEEDDLLLYENTSTIFHVTNLTFIQNFVDTTLKELGIEHDNTNYPDTPRHTKFDSHLNIIQTFLDQLAISRPKRAIENSNVIAIMIEYPILYKKCKLHETRALSQPDGKLIINKEIAKCGNVYQNIQNCKFELRYNYCKTQKDNNTCVLFAFHI